MIHRVAACRLKPSARFGCISASSGELRSAHAFARAIAPRMQEAQVANGSVVEPLPDDACLRGCGAHFSVSSRKLLLRIRCTWSVGLELSKAAFVLDDGEDVVLKKA